MLPLVVAALLAGADTVTPAPSPSPSQRPGLFARRPHLVRDATLAAAASVAVAMGKPDIRRAIFRDGSVGNVIDNFAFPIAQVRAGTRRDTDPFWVNNIAHPVSFGVEALYLKHQGYGNAEAFLFTQAHSVVWEFVVEGCAFEPSGKDLVTDAVGAAAAIWVIHPLVRRWTATAPVRVAVRPMPGGVAVRLTARF
jgi:hypothetical protein